MPADNTASAPDYVYNGISGIPVTVIVENDIPVIDAHMHIQSNNVCPMPIQWAIVANSIAAPLLGRPTKTRKELVSTGIGLIGKIAAGRMMNIGMLSSEMVAGVYMQELIDDDMKLDSCWTVMHQKKIDKAVQAGEEEIKLLLHKAGKKAHLSKMSKQTQKSELLFEEETSYYFAGYKKHRMAVALTMDFTFAHYWGKFGLPVYLKSNRSMYYINDYMACKIKREKIAAGNIRNTVILDDSVHIPHDENQQVHQLVHLYPFHGETDPCNRFYKIQFDLFNTPRYQPRQNEIPLIKIANTARDQALASKKFVHFVDVAVDEDEKHYEGYKDQLQFYISSTVSFPLSLFPFYHYDPRCHILTKEPTSQGTQIKTAQDIVNEIVRNHSFFTYSHNSKIETSSPSEYNYYGAVEAQYHPELNNPDALLSIIEYNCRSTPDALGELFQFDMEHGTGMFWGIKIYPRLGYSPCDYTTYPNLRDLYSYCETNNIPMNSHTGPNGMAISDYFLYKKYDNGLNEPIYNLKDSENWFDGTIPAGTSKDSPIQWGEVLHDYPDLKLCLAHFGSAAYWRDIEKELFGLEKAEEELQNRIARNFNFESSAYDSCLKYRNWVRKIAELVTEKNNVFTDLAYFNIKENDDYKLQHLTRDLIFIITKFPALKDRIMLGSDWYMIEVDKDIGTGEYYQRLFIALRDVSRDVGFDCWHQFGVVNPLRFLGLIEETKGSTGPFCIDAEKIEKYSNRLKVIASDRDKKEWRTKYNMDKGIDKINEEIDARLNALRDMEIVDGCDMKRNDKLIILKD